MYQVSINLSSFLIVSLEESWFSHLSLSPELICKIFANFY